jgi:zinc protease
LLVAAALGGCASSREARRAGGPAAAGGSETVLLEVEDDPTVTFKVWFRTGSWDDPPGKEGLAYLTGRLIEEGSTTRRSYEQILHALYPLAASYSVRADHEMTVLTGRTHRDNLAIFQELFEDAYLRPAFAEEDFQRLRTDQLNYLRNTLRYSSDEDLAKAVLHSFVFEGQRHAHPPQGTVAGIESITLDDVRAFYRSHYTRADAVLALGGGLDPGVVQRARAALDGLPAGESARRAVPPPPAFEGREVLVVSKPDADASISFGFPIDVRRGDPSFYALWIANSWLGEHRNSASRLFQVIRERRGLNYGDYSYIEAFPEGGRRSFPPVHVGRSRQSFEVWIRTLPNAQAHFALRAALRELTRLAERGMGREEFELTREFLSKYLLHFAETTAARLGYAVDDRFYGIGGAGHLARFQERLREVTLEEVNAAVRAHLRPERVKIAIVTGDAARLAEALAADAPSPVTYATPKPEAVLAEDGEIAVFPLGIRREAIRIVPVDQVFER